jgi:LPS O-antigen subunit length determinant protein (WzzB/FepE family)
MGKIDISNFQIQKGKAFVLPHVTKPKESVEVFDKEKLLFLKHLKIRSRSGDIDSQTFSPFSYKIDLSLP